TSALLDEELTVHGTGNSARDFLHVADTCRGIDMILSAPLEVVQGEVFNLASGEHRTINSIANDVVELMRYPTDRIQLIGEGHGRVVRHTGDWSKINRLLGWSPQVSWHEGLERTIRWYTDNRDLWSKQLFMRRIPIVTAGGKREYH